MQWAVPKMIGRTKGQVIRHLHYAAISLLITVSGCDSKAPEPPVAKEKAAVVTDAPVEATASTKKQEEKKKVKKPLNLAMPDQEGVVAEDGVVIAENNKLPNMFHDSKAEGTKVGGGIIRDEENENYVDSIQGAEVNVEFSID